MRKEPHRTFILRLLPKVIAKTVGGEVRFHARDLLELSAREMQQIRGDPDRQGRRRKRPTAQAAAPLCGL